MGTLLLMLAAVLSSASALVYVSYFATLTLIASFGIAVLLWAPTNWLFTKAQTKVKDLTSALIIFSVSATLSDTFVGIFLQGVEVKNVSSLLVGLITGLVVIIVGSKSKDFDQPKAAREYVLYAITFASIFNAFIFNNMWQLLVAAYAIADLAGAALSLRLLSYIKPGSKFTSIQEFFIGTITFAPLTLITVLLFRLITNIAIVGPAATIMSCGVALIGAKWLISKSIKFTDLMFLGLSIMCVSLIYSSF